MHWCVIKAIEMLAAHCLFGRPLPIESVEAKRKEIDLIQDGGRFKRQKDIDHQNHMHIPIICHLRTPPPLISHWSLHLRKNEVESGRYCIMAAGS